jgi:hypothetical protein
MVLGYRSPGRKRANSPVIPHKATNKGSSGPFELHSWLCAEKQRLPEEDFQDPKKKRGWAVFELHSWLCAEKRIRRLNLPRRQVLPLRKG